MTCMSVSADVSVSKSNVMMDNQVEITFMSEVHVLAFMLLLYQLHSHTVSCVGFSELCRLNLQVFVWQMHLEHAANEV